MSDSSILFFCPTIYPETVGGLEIYYYHLINELSKKQNIILLTTSHGYHNDRIKIFHISARLFLIRKFIFGKISLFITTSLILLWLFIKKEKISLIHLPYTSNSGYYGYFFPFIKQVFGLPYIIYLHGGGMRVWMKHDGNSILLKNAVRIIAVSDTIKNEYEERTGQKIEVVLPLVPYQFSLKSKNQLKQQYGFSDEDKVIIMVGSIKPIKGNIWVYEEFRNLERNWIYNKKVTLLFIGKGSDSAKLKKMILDDGMQDKVRIIDRIPNEKIHEIYGLADYYVIGSDFEGTPKSLIEALYNGLPIIGTDVNGIHNIIKNKGNGLLVNKLKSGELTDSIKCIVENRQLADFIAERAKSTYNNNFNYTGMLHRLVNIYNEYSFKSKA